MGTIRDLSKRTTGDHIVDGSVQAVDLDTTTPGQAVITKIIEGANVTIASTGVDAGTGQVTINANVAAVPITFNQDKSSDSTITGAIDGVNKVFTLSGTPLAGSLLFHINGMALEAPTHYSLSGAIITMLDAPSNVGQNDSLLAYYVT